ncbi:MAG: aggregation factor core [Rhodobacteraceae bacterium]|nr:aggregation factor core [Paracoccaceae bacterium]
MNGKTLIVAGLLALAVGVPPGQAELMVQFDEGAPNDMFRIENAGACAILASSVHLDLSTSRGGLIFDVTAQGAGVEVYQPFELVEGSDALQAPPSVQDGQSKIALDIVQLPSGGAIAFTIDVDDTIGQRAITVSGAEIEGATVTLASAASRETAEFSDLARAAVPVAGCDAASNG